MAKKLRRSQAIVNTSMVYFLKYTRLYSIEYINKYLVACACLLIATKSTDEPVPIDYLVEWYIYFETKRTGNRSKIDISSSKKEYYSERILEQEFDIICEIGMDFEVDLPNTYIAQFAASPIGKQIFAEFNCSQFVYKFLNDSFMTTVALYYPAQQVAAACIFMACIFMSTQAHKIGAGKLDTDALNETEWYKQIDEDLDLSILTEVKDEIKKCYAKPTSS